MRLLGTALFLCFAISCSDSNDAPLESTSVTQVLGPEGGSVSAGGATLTIPKGALAESKELKVTVSNEKPPAGFAAVSKLYRCEPSSLALAVDATMEMPFTDDGKPVKMFWSTGSDASFKDIGGTKGNGTTMIATVKSLSAGFVGRAE